MGSHKYWQTRLDFFTSPDGEATVMAHLFAPEVEPSRSDPKKDERSAVQKALSPAALLAIEKDDLDFLKLLVEKGLKVNEPLDFQSSKTALYHAVWERKPEIVKYLLSIGADPEMKNASGERPIQLAIEWELKEIIPLLAQPTKVEQLIEGVPEGLLDAIFARYFTEEIMFLSWNGKDAPKGIVKFLKKRMPKIRNGSRLETLEDRPLGAHSWYRDKIDKGFGSRLELTVKEVGKDWQVGMRDSKGPVMAGHGWESLFFKKLVYWMEKSESTWDE